MASYVPPDENPPIFNPSNWQYASGNLTLAAADARYLQLSGGTERGIVFFNAGLDTGSISHLGNAFTMPSSTGTLALTSQLPTSATYVDLVSAQPTIAGDKGWSDIATFNNTVNCNSALAIGPTGSFSFSSGSANAALTFGGLSNVSLALPITTGTLALVSQIPTNTSYVDLTTTQNVGGLKTFTTTLAVGGAIVASTNGSASNPIYSVGGTTSGMYAGAANQLNFTVSSSSKLTITTASTTSSQQIRSVSGAVGTPGLSFSSDTTSGLWLVGASNPAIAAAGVQTVNWTATREAIIAGSASTPSLGFGTDTGTGFYRPTTNQVGIAISGSNLVTYSSTGEVLAGKLTATQLQVASNGSTLTKVLVGSYTYASSIAPGATATATVTFGSAFSSAPDVLLTVCSTSAVGSYQNFVIVSASDVTTSQFTLQLANARTLDTVNANFRVAYYAYN